jgi:tRNA threonylcarbamoyladenosine biosynthesis protein TsaE
LSGSAEEHLDTKKDEEEAIQIGVEDYLYSGNYCLIEWPSLIKKMVPLEVVMVTIELIGTHQRKFIFQK